MLLSPLLPWHTAPYRGMLSDKLQDPDPFADIQRDTSWAGPIHIMVRLAMNADTDAPRDVGRICHLVALCNGSPQTSNRAFCIEFSIGP